MRRRFIPVLSAAICLGIAASSGGQLFAGERNGDGREDGTREVVVGEVQHFATLPERISPTGVALGHPEGLCADSDGNIYANSFEQPTSTGYVQNYIYAFNRQGKLVSATPTPNGVVPLGCTVSGHKFYVNSVFAGDELEYTLPLSETSLPNTYHVCGGFVGNPGLPCGLNANYVGPDHRVYMTDNGAALFGLFTGRIWVLDPKTGSASVFIAPSELAVANLPLSNYVPDGTVLPYSANGLAFSHDGAALYIANMSTNKIYKQKVKRCSDPIGGCEPEGDIKLFSHDPLHFISGPDNIDFDNQGNLWIASGQEQHVVALNEDGNVAGVFGSFKGFDGNGAPKGLLQPSGVIFSKGKIYIGNESSQNLLPASDNINWSALKRFTISEVSTDLLEGRHSEHDDH